MLFLPPAWTAATAVIRRCYQAIVRNLPEDWAKKIERLSLQHVHAYQGERSGRAVSRSIHSLCGTNARNDRRDASRPGRPPIGGSFYRHADAPTPHQNFGRINNCRLNCNLKMVSNRLSKVQKHIVKKKGKKPNLHENSRDTQRLQSAAAKDDKLNRVAKLREKMNAPYCKWEEARKCGARKTHRLV